MASKLHSGIAAYSSYIGLVSTRIVYPQQEDPDVKIDQYSYFDITGTIPPPVHHSLLQLPYLWLDNHTREGPKPIQRV